MLPANAQNSASVETRQSSSRQTLSWLVKVWNRKFEVKISL